MEISQLVHFIGEQLAVEAELRGVRNELSQSATALDGLCARPGQRQLAREVEGLKEGIAARSDQ
jgi:hypothetical protein